MADDTKIANKDGSSPEEDETKKSDSSSTSELPLSRTNIVSYVTYAWLDRFMWKAFRRGLTVNDIWKCSYEEGSEHNVKLLEEAWHEEQKNKGKDASLFRVFLRYVRKHLFIATIILILSLGVLVLTAAYFLLSVLAFSISKSEELWYGLLFVLALFLADILQNGLFLTVFTLTHTAATRLRSGALAMVYQKLLSLRVLGEQSSGNLVNIFASDSARLFEGVTYAPMLLTAPVLAIGATCYACYLLGPWPLFGFLILLFLFPVQMILGKIIMTYREKAIAATDRRVRLMNEILSNIKFIKMYAWETSFHSAVTEIRTEERKVIEKVNLATAMAFSVSMIIVAIATIVTIMALTLTGNDLSPAKAFTYLAVFTSIQGKLMLSTIAVKYASEFKVAAERIQRFLQIKQQIKRQKISPNRQSVPPDSNYIIDVRSATLSWPSLTSKSQNESSDTNKHGEIHTKNSETHNDRSDESEAKPMLNSENTNKHSSHSQFALQKLSFKIEKGDVLGLAGGVGCGKTALINAILGQLSIEEGDVIVRGDIAYVPQVPWIINATLRDNIIFGHSWDQERYDRVIKSCCLKDDLDNLLAGDATEIGERGINLSGGQKQRISLARAVYSERDIYLLDDPFSAVDPDVAEKLYQLVLQNELVGKTIILATHQVKIKKIKKQQMKNLAVSLTALFIVVLPNNVMPAYAGLAIVFASQFLSHCDNIFMLQHGSIIERGSHEDLVEKENGVYAEFISHVDGREQDFQTRARAFSEADSEVAPLQSTESIITSTTASKTTLRQLSQTPALQLIKDEEKEVGAVSTMTYRTYIWCAGGVVAILSVFLLFLATEGVRAFSYWWLAYWISQGSGVKEPMNGTDPYDNSTSAPSIPNISDHPRLHFFNLVYGLTVVILLIILILRSFIYSKVVMRASSNIHQGLLNAVLHLPMSFFDVTPLGRIINRFSKDMDELDSGLPPVMDQTVQCMLAITTYLVMIGVVIHWFLIVVPPLAAIFIFLYVIFRRGSRDLQRLQNISVSPLLSHISTTVQGLSSIHAYDKVDEFYKRFITLQDHNSVMVLLCNLSQRWVNLRLSLVTTLAVSLTALFIVVFPNNVMPAYAGLAIVYASQLSTLFQFFVRMAVETETKFISAERINSYNQSMEDETLQVNQPRSSPQPWPSKGQIKFIEFSASYRHGLPLVLTDINLEIKPGEKVGLVGRTGSGKSSLAASLFRLFEAQNGRIEIDGVDISELNLIELRSNLSVIPQESVMFKGTIRSNLDPARRNIDHEIWHALERCQIKDMVNSLEDKLDAPVAENGENYSYGERQLICMARALLRHSKILVLDEATASIDTETDTLIQHSLRSAFNDCTMIVIAHRFSTVMDLDKVIVMDHGKIIEMDAPQALIANKDSKFSKLMALRVDGVSSTSAENILSDAWV